jgi:HEAT repeat protein
MKNKIAKGIARKKLLGKEEEAVYSVAKNWDETSLHDDFLTMLNECKPESIIYLTWMIHKNWHAEASKEILQKMDASPIEELIREYERGRIKKSIIIKILGSLGDPSASEFLISNLIDPTVKQSCEKALLDMKSISVPALIQNLNDERRRESLIEILILNQKYSIKPLINSLYDIEIRKFSSYCLSKIGKPAASALIDSSTDPQLANVILDVILENPKEFTIALIKSLNNKKYARFCEMAILKIGKEAIPSLGLFLKDPYAERIEFILFLMGEEVIPYLISWLSISEIRQKSMKLIKKFELNSIPYLINSLNKNSVLTYAEQILIEYEGPIHQQLIGALKKKSIQNEVKNIIEQKGKNILPFLYNELENTYDDSHKIIVEILGFFKDESSILPLIHAFYNDELRESAKKSLLKIGKGIIPPLISNLNEKRINKDLIEIIVFFKGGSVPCLIDSLKNPILQNSCAECLEKIGEPAIEDLISLYAESDLEQVAYKIIVKNGKSSVKYLIKSLNDEKKKRMCKRTLIDIGEPAIPELIDNLMSIYQQDIYQILLDIGECTIPYLIENFIHDDIRPTLSKLISDFDVHGIPYLIESLENIEIAHYSEDLLVKSSMPIDEYLITALENSQIKDRVKKIIILRGPSIISRLHVELKKKYKNSHKALIDILGAFHDHKSTEVLIQALYNNELRENAEKALLMIGKRTISKLILHLDKKEIRESLIDILVKLQEDSIVPLITNLQNDIIRDYCAECLEKIGEPAIEEIIYILDDPVRSDIAIDLLVKNKAISVKYLIKHLIDKKLSEYCSKVLHEIGEFAVPQLIMAMQKSNQLMIKDILLNMGDITIPYLLDFITRDELRPEIMEILNAQSLDGQKKLISYLDNEEINKYIMNIIKNTDQSIDKYLIDSLNNENIQTQIKEILLSRDKKALPFLHKKLNEEFYSDQIIIIEILGELNHEESIKYIISSLQYPEAFSLSRKIINNYGVKAINHLIESLDDEKINDYVIDILLEMGEIILPYTRQSIHQIKNKKYAIYILGKLKDKQGIQILKRMQVSSEEDTRLYASCALAILGEKINLEILFESLKKREDVRLKDFALLALDTVSDPRSVDDLLRIFNIEKNNYYKCYLLRILGNIGDLKAIEGILELLKHEKDKAVRFFIIKTLKNYKNPEYIPKIKKILELDFQISHEKWIQKNEDLIEFFGTDLLYNEEETNLEELFNAYQWVFDYTSHKLEKRDQQIQYIITCYEGIYNKIPVIIEGPTGIGKTRGLITAFLPFILKNEGYRVLYCTRTINQLENFMEELSIIRNNLYEKHGISNMKVSLNIGRKSMQEKTCPDIESCNDCKLKNNQDYSYADRDFFMDFNELRKVRANGHCPLATAR